VSAPAADPLRSRLQTTLGTAYTLERELGGGGMSRVFVAEETRFRRRVVLKVLAPELAEGLSDERFPCQIRLAAALQERHSVPVLTADERSGAPRLRRGVAANAGARPLAPAPRPAPRP
jgi:serine/threonine-protein kinase